RRRGTSADRPAAAADQRDNAASSGASGPEIAARTASSPSFSIPAAIQDAAAPVPMTGDISGFEERTSRTDGSTPAFPADAEEPATALPPHRPAARAPSAERSAGGERSRRSRAA